MTTTNSNINFSHRQHHSDDNSGIVAAFDRDLYSTIEDLDSESEQMVDLDHILGSVENRRGSYTDEQPAYHRRNKNNCRSNSTREHVNTSQESRSSDRSYILDSDDIPTRDAGLDLSFSNSASRTHRRENANGVDGARSKSRGIASQSQSQSEPLIQRHPDDAADRNHRMYSPSSSSSSATKKKKHRSERKKGGKRREREGSTNNNSLNFQQKLDRFEKGTWEEMEQQMSPEERGCGHQGARFRRPSLWEINEDSRKLTITPHNVDMLLISARFYNQGDVIVLCKDALLNCNVENALYYKFVSEKHELNDVAPFVDDFVRANFLSIVNTHSFLGLDANRACSFLSDDAIKVSGELDVFHAARAWIDHCKHDRLKDVVALLSCIRFNHIAPEDIVRQVEPNAAFFMGVDGQELLLNMYRYHALQAGNTESSTLELLPPRCYVPLDVEPPVTEQRTLTEPEPSAVTFDKETPSQFTFGIQPYPDQTSPYTQLGTVDEASPISSVPSAHPVEEASHYQFIDSGSIFPQFLGTEDSHQPSAQDPRMSQIHMAGAENETGQQQFGSSMSEHGQLGDGLQNSSWQSAMTLQREPSEQITPDSVHSVWNLSAKTHPSQQSVDNPQVVATRPSDHSNVTSQRSAGTLKMEGYPSQPRLVPSQLNTKSMQSVGNLSMKGDPHLSEMNIGPSQQSLMTHVMGDESLDETLFSPQQSVMTGAGSRTDTFPQNERYLSQHTVRPYEMTRAPPQRRALSVHFDRDPFHHVTFEPHLKQGPSQQSVMGGIQRTQSFKTSPSQQSVIEGFQPTQSFQTIPSQQSFVERIQPTQSYKSIPSQQSVLGGIQRTQSFKTAPSQQSVMEGTQPTQSFQTIPSQRSFMGGIQRTQSFKAAPSQQSVMDGIQRTQSFKTAPSQQSVMDGIQRTQSFQTSPSQQSVMEGTQPTQSFQTIPSQRSVMGGIQRTQSFKTAPSQQSVMDGIQRTQSFKTAPSQQSVMEGTHPTQSFQTIPSQRSVMGGIQRTQSFKTAPSQQSVMDGIQRTQSFKTASSQQSVMDGIQRTQSFKTAPSQQSVMEVTQPTHSFESIPSQQNFMDGIQRTQSFKTAPSQQSFMDGIQRTQSFKTAPSQQSVMEGTQPTHSFESIPSQQNFMDGIQRTQSFKTAPSQQSVMEGIQRTQSFKTAPSQQSVMDGIQRTQSFKTAPSQQSVMEGTTPVHSFESIPSQQNFMDGIQRTQSFKTAPSQQSVMDGIQRTQSFKTAPSQQSVMEGIQRTQSFKTAPSQQSVMDGIQRTQSFKTAPSQQSVMFDIQRTQSFKTAPSQQSVMDEIQRTQSFKTAPSQQSVMDGIQRTQSFKTAPSQQSVMKGTQPMHSFESIPSQQNFMDGIQRTQSFKTAPSQQSVMDGIQRTQSFKTAPSQQSVMEGIQRTQSFKTAPSQQSVMEGIQRTQSFKTAPSQQSVMDGIQRTQSFKYAPSQHSFESSFKKLQSPENSDDLTETEQQNETHNYANCQTPSRSLVQERREALEQILAGLNGRMESQTLEQPRFSGGERGRDNSERYETIKEAGDGDCVECDVSIAESPQTQRWVPAGSMCNCIGEAECDCCQCPTLSPRAQRHEVSVDRKQQNVDGSGDPDYRSTATRRPGERLSEKQLQELESRLLQRKKNIAKKTCGWKKTLTCSPLEDIDEEEYKGFVEMDDEYEDEDEELPQHDSGLAMQTMTSVRISVTPSPVQFRTTVQSSPHKSPQQRNNQCYENCDDCKHEFDDYSECDDMAIENTSGNYPSPRRGKTYSVTFKPDNENILHTYNSSYLFGHRLSPSIKHEQQQPHDERNNCSTYTVRQSQKPKHLQSPRSRESMNSNSLQHSRSLEPVGRDKQQQQLLKIRESFNREHQQPQQQQQQALFPRRRETGSREPEKSPHQQQHQPPRSEQRRSPGKGPSSNSGIAQRQMPSRDGQTPHQTYQRQQSPSKEQKSSSVAQPCQVQATKRHLPQRDLTVQRQERSPSKIRDVRQPPASPRQKRLSEHGLDKMKKGDPRRTLAGRQRSLSAGIPNKQQSSGGLTGASGRRQGTATSRSPSRQTSRSGSLSPRRKDSRSSGGSSSNRSNNLSWNQNAAYAPYFDERVDPEYGPMDSSDSYFMNEFGMDTVPGNSAILTIGGLNPKELDPEIPCRLLQQYEEATNSWSLLAKLPEPRHHHGCVMLDGYLYVIGGSVVDTEDLYNMSNSTNTCYRYDFAGDFWAEIAPMRCSRMYHAVAVLEGVIYAVGGESTAQLQDEEHPFLDSCEYYNADADQWGPIANLLDGTVGAAVIGYNGLLWVIGGFLEHGEDNVVLAVVECYDPRTNSWSSRNPLPNPRCHASVCEVLGCLFLVGGSVVSYSGQPVVSLDEVLLYHDNLDLWEVFHTLTVPRHDASCCAVDSRLYIMGGVSSFTSEVLSDVECLDVETGEWLDGTEPLPYAALGLVCVSINPEYSPEAEDFMDQPVGGSMDWF